MSISVQNTSSALLALQTLNRLNDASQTDGSATVAATSDQTSSANPAVIAQPQALNIDALGAVTGSLDRAASITDAAQAGGRTVGDLLGQMTAWAKGGGSNAAQDAFQVLLQQLSDAVAGSGFDGVNLLDGSQAGQSVLAGGGPAGTVALAGQNLTPGGPTIVVDGQSDLSTTNGAFAALGDLYASSDNLASAMGQLDNQSQQIQAHAGFISRLSDVLGAGESTSAPSSADGARLMALQIQQALQLQGGSIATASPQVILSLFK